MTATQYLSDLGHCLKTPVATEGDDGVPLDVAVDRFVNHVAHVRACQRVVHLVGNGGSASVVAHTQNGLTQAGGVRALIYQDAPVLTAYANDHGYHNSYSDALGVWIDPDDLLIAVSSSGSSPNILNAVQRAKDAGTVVVTCSGFLADNPLRTLGDLNFYVPSSDYGHVELTHEALLHCLTDRVAHAR